MDNETLQKKNEDKEETIEHLKQKAKGGVGNVVSDILNDKTVQKAISKSMFKQSLKYGLLLSTIILGAMSILNYVKSVYSTEWIDLPVGIILLLIGVSYVVNELKKNSNM